MFSVPSSEARSSTKGNIIDVRGKSLMVGVEFASPGGAASDISRNPSKLQNSRVSARQEVLRQGNDDTHDEHLRSGPIYPTFEDHSGRDEETFPNLTEPSAGI
jgi:hypothetical protein